MKDLSLVYNEERRVDALSPSEHDALVGEALADREVLRKSGHHIVSNGRDLNDTIRGASQIAPVRLGCIEVRPLRELAALAEEARRQ